MFTLTEIRGQGGVVLQVFEVEAVKEAGGVTSPGGGTCVWNSFILNQQFQ